MRRKSKSFFAVVCYTLLTFASYAQSDNQLINQKLENIAENTNSEDLDYTHILEQIEYYKFNPINLNNTGYEPLSELHLLSEIQLINFFNHIRKHGKLIAIQELQSIDGFDLTTIYTLLPYVTLKNNTIESLSFKTILKEGKNELIIRNSRVLEKQKGFSPITDSALNANPNARYLGSPDKLFFRYKFNYANKIGINFIAEKDAGEEFFRGTQKNGFDYYSANLFLKNIGKIKALVLGDYVVNFGQGLVMWANLGFSKTSDALNIKRNAVGIKPYTSINETNFLRGAAITIQTNKINYTLFASHKLVDATAGDTLDNGELQTITSLQETGIHATANEIAYRKNSAQTIVGGNMCYTHNQLKLGITALHTQFSNPLARNLQPYSLYEFTGKELYNIGADYNYLWKNINLFGEIAYSNSGGIATVNGLMASIDSRVSVSLLYRNYQLKYQALLSNPFGEGSNPWNEKGFYIGTTIKINNATTLNAYHDIFVFPWLRYQIDAPSYGYDRFIQLNYEPTKKFSMYARYRKRDKFKNSTNNERIDFTSLIEQENYRVNSSFQATQSIKIQQRIELLHLLNQANKKEYAFITYCDLSIKKPKGKITFTARYALFDTESYNSRIYVFENDVPGSYSIPAYYYKGSRFYILLDYTINKHLTLWLRLSQTIYDNVNVISAGSLNEINGNTRTDVRTQLSYKF
ncbi:MAG: hypothetical protein J0M08_03705 [Bacteroidetes bacterium]|nr:hypothetical protein [Bacteroidota bacterium]